MKNIDYKKIVDTIADLYCRACCQLPDDVLKALHKAQQNDTNTHAKKILTQLIENADIAKQKNIPICQDTGLAIVFIEMGTEVKITPPAENPNATIIDAVNEGIALAAEKGLLRKSLVAEPLNQRKNTNSNTPAVIHLSVTSGRQLKISLMAKGGGCENKSQFKMFNPTETKQNIINWIKTVVTQAGANACPPFIIGIGLGGSFEQCCLLSKKALLKKIEQKHPDQFYQQMETELLNEINSLNIGPQGLGGKTTALAVHIETAPCHIASLPVAVNIECHAHRHKSATL